MHAIDLGAELGAEVYVFWGGREGVETDAFKGAYSAEKAAALKAAQFDRAALGARGLAYERLDQLTVEILMGVR